MASSRRLRQRGREAGPIERILCALLVVVYPRLRLLGVRGNTRSPGTADGPWAALSISGPILGCERLKEAAIVHRTIREPDWRPWNPLPLFRFFSPPLVSPQIAILGFLLSSAYYDVFAITFLSNH